MTRLVLFLALLPLVFGSSLNIPTCDNVFNVVLPCREYVTDKANDPGSNCCKGLISIKNMGKTRADRQAICVCLKKGANLLPGLDKARVAGLPKKCGVDYDVPLDPNIDCTKISIL